MKKFVCSVCGYVHEGDSPPERCPQCGVGADKFNEQGASLDVDFVDEHSVGIAKGLDEGVIKDLQANFTAECTEVGMYLAMSRQAIREGYTEIGEFYRTAAWEEAEHASKFAEMLGEVLSDSTRDNVSARMHAEAGACLGKKELAAKAKQLGYDAIHDTVHEMAKDEARHGRGFAGLLKRYFG